MLAEVTRRVLETGLQVEMSEHLGYDKHAVEGRNGGNSRNGTRSTTVLTDIARSTSTCHAIATAASHPRR
jgi:transposase-like protein